MADNFQRHQYKLQRRYTFTKTKAIIGFLFSTFLSIVLSTYFDDYGLDILKQTEAIFSAEETGPPARRIKKLPPTKDLRERDDISELRDRLYEE